MRPPMAAPGGQPMMQPGMMAPMGMAPAGMMPQQQQQPVVMMAQHPQQSSQVPSTDQNGKNIQLDPFGAF